MIRLIGFRCTHSNVFSREVLSVRFLLGNVRTIAKNLEGAEEIPRPSLVLGLENSIN